MKSVLGFFLGFLPWILFAVLAGPTLEKLKTAIVVSLLATVVVGYKELRKGFILTWGSLLFFCLNLVMVVWLENLWFAKNMEILVHLALASIAWFSILVGKPFTLQYARERTPKEQWESPIFFRICRDISVIWGLLFLFTTALSLLQARLGIDPMLYRTLSFLSIAFGAWINEWYPKMMRKRFLVQAE